MRRDTQGHVAEPREPTRCLGGAKEARTRGRGHASPHGRPGGATWRCEGWQVKGPRVSGLWLEVWGGNANVLCRPSFYTHMFSLFLSCGTMFPQNSLFAGHVAERGALDMIASNVARRCGGLGVHWITISTRALKGI